MTPAANTPEHPVRVFISHAYDSTRAEAQALSEQLRVMGAEVLGLDPLADGSPDIGSLVRQRLREADVYVLLISPGDERRRWIQFETSIMLEKWWENRSTRVDVVAPAVGAIPSGLRGKTFVSYVPAQSVQFDRWTEGKGVAEFAAMVLAGDHGTLSGHNHDLDSRLREQILHIADSSTAEPFESRLALLRQNLPAMRRIVEARSETRRRQEYCRLLVDWALIALNGHALDLASEYFGLASSEYERLSDDGDSSADLPYRLGLVALGLHLVHPAITYFTEASRRSAALERPHHPLTIAAAYNLGLAFSAAGNLDDAQSEYREALAAAEVELGRAHPQTAAILYNLALVQQQRGAREDAINLLRQALEAYEIARPKESPEVRAVAEHLDRLTAEVE